MLYKSAYFIVMIFSDTKISVLLCADHNAQLTVAVVGYDLDVPAVLLDTHARPGPMSPAPPAKTVLDIYRAAFSAAGTNTAVLEFFAAQDRYFWHFILPKKSEYHFRVFCKS